MKRIVLALCMIIGLSGVSYAADGDPCAAHFGSNGVTTPDTDAELCGSTVPYVNTTSSSTTTCSAGSISASTIDMASATNWDTSGGTGAICDNSGHCNVFNYTGITSTTINGVTNASNGGLTTCTGNYASGSSLWVMTTATSLANRLKVLKDAIQNTQSYVSGSTGYRGVFSVSQTLDTGNTTYSGLSGYGAAGNQTTESLLYATEIPTDGTLSQLACTINTAPGGGKSWVFTARRVFVGDTTLTCTISGASATTCSDMTHVPTVSANQVYDLKAVPSGTPASAVAACTMIFIGR